MKYLAILFLLTNYNVFAQVNTTNEQLTIKEQEKKNLKLLEQKLAEFKREQYLKQKKEESK